MVLELKLDALLERFEREILSGRARWIADLSESFRDYKLNGDSFDLMVRGQTRPSGFLLSRFFAWTVLPNYRVSLYVKTIKNSMNFSQSKLSELRRIIKNEMERHDMKWAWLVLFFENDAPSEVQSSIEGYDRADVGIGSISVSSGAITVSNNILGRSLLRQMRLHKLLSELERKKSRENPGP